MGRLNKEKDEQQEEKEKPLFKHFSHKHPLQLTSNTPEASQFSCQGCGIQILAGIDHYTCRTCQFSLHKSCYEMPKKIHHPADPGHDLILLLMPSFACKACGKHGSGFSYTCRICLHSYHTLCLVLPLSASHSSHPHPLNLEFSPPYPVKGFRCDICRNIGRDHWLYRCGACSFDIHLNCALSNQQPQPNQCSNGVMPNQFGTSGQVLYVQPNGVAMANLQPYPGANYGNQMVVNGQNQGGMSGMKGLIVGSVAVGMGQAVAQEMVHSVVSGLGDGSGSSSHGDLDIIGSWIGGSDYY